MALINFDIIIITSNPPAPILTVRQPIRDLRQPIITAHRITTTTMELLLVMEIHLTES